MGDFFSYLALLKRMFRYKRCYIFINIIFWCEGVSGATQFLNFKKNNNNYKYLYFQRSQYFEFRCNTLKMLVPGTILVSMC